MLQWKRQEYVLCKPWSAVREDLTRCPRSQWVIKCMPKNQYAICSQDRVDLQTGKCVTAFDDFRCCVPGCP